MGIEYSGPLGAEVLIIGDFPDESDKFNQQLFSGSAGVELTKMLHEAGFIRSDCRLSVVSLERPRQGKLDYLFGTKKESFGCVEFQGRLVKETLLQNILKLRSEIEQHPPKLILTFGELPLWALTGNKGITSWQGSVLDYNSIPLVCTYSPESILKTWENRFITVHALRRAMQVYKGECRKPDYNLIISPSFQIVIEQLDEFLNHLSQGPYHLSVDIETVKSHMACLAIAWSQTRAICIPWIDRRKEDKHYWSFDEELLIRQKLCQVLTHPNLKGSGQNWLYDAQYFARYFGIEMNLWRDTMTQHHVLFAGLPNSLAFQANLYLDWYRYWKDDGKEQGGGDQLQWWEYNCIDACNTYAIAEAQTEVERKLKFPSTEYGTPSEIQHSLHEPVFAMMLRGVRVDTTKKKELVLKIMDQIALRETWLNSVLGKPLNARSPKQLQTLFYEEFKQKKIFNRKAKGTGPTTNADALLTIAKREPLLSPLVETINEIRELSNARAFCAQQLDLDKRIRCSYNISGTETYRFASSEDAFGFGTNLQNVTQGYEPKPEELERGITFSIPNLRELFIPDVGYTIGEFDLSAADAQVVAADAGDWELLDAFQSGIDLHTGNVSRWSVSRDVAKGCLHATNYGASARALSLTFGISLQHGEHIINDWYVQHPKIKEWHDKILIQLMTRRYVENAFGYRRFYFGRLENLLKEALAWIPQSTVAIVTNLGIRNIYRNLPSVQVLLQTHDSATVQWPFSFSNAKAQILSQMHIPIPYPRPLIIPVGVKTSMKSWGQVEK